MASKKAVAATNVENIKLQFKVHLTPAEGHDVKKSRAKGMLPVFTGAGNKLAKVNVGGQAFNLLLSKTTTWEP
jgi:hypothetical protein